VGSGRLRPSSGQAGRSTQWVNRSAAGPHGGERNGGSGLTRGSVERDGTELGQLGQRVIGVDLLQGASLGTHDEGLGGGAELVVLDAAEDLAVGDAGGGEGAVVAPDMDELSEEDRVTRDPLVQPPEATRFVPH